MERVYCVAMPLEPLRVGAWVERARWPRHVTVVGNFRAEPASVDVLGEILRRTAASVGPPVAHIGGDARFGPEADSPVQLVESDDVPRLHVALLDAFTAYVDLEPCLPARTRASART